MFQVRVLLAALGVIEQEEDREGHGGVDRGADELVEPENVEVGVTEEAAVDEEEQESY